MLQYGPMYTLYCWFVTLRIVARYFLYRMGIGTRPNFTDRWPEVQRFYRQVTRMDPRIRLRGLAHFPGSHPAVYAGNHVKLDDPFFVCYAVQEASDYTMRIRFVMRDDFFVGFPWNCMPFRMNEIAEMGGAYNISKEGVTLAQLKPLIDILLEPDSFVIFPNGSRSRSGLWFEYRDDIDAPGSVSFFLAQAQRKNPDIQVPAMPVGRTYNPVTKISTVILGPPAYLEPGARREAQRDFDDDLILAISNLVEVQLHHLVGGLLYLRCLHGWDDPVPTEALAAEVATVVSALDSARYVEPVLAEKDVTASLSATLTYFADYQMVTLSGGRVRLDPARILASPPVDVDYRKKNPVKFSVNQILHLPDVVAALEQVLGGAMKPVKIP